MASWTPGQRMGWEDPCPESQKCWSNSVMISTACSPPPMKPEKWTSTGGAPGKPQEKVPNVTVQRAKRQRYQGKREKGFIYLFITLQISKHQDMPKDIHFSQVSSRKAGLTNATAGCGPPQQSPSPAGVQQPQELSKPWFVPALAANTQLCHCT